jgi:hypothetical protein
VIDVKQADGPRDDVMLYGSIAGEEWAGVVSTLDEGVDGITVGGDAGDDDLAVFVAELSWLLDAAGSATGGLAPGLASIVDPERDGVNAVAVLVDVVAYLAVGSHSCRENEADLTLLQHVGRTVAPVCLRARIGDQRHAECGAIEVGRLARVADVKLNVVGTLEGEKIRIGSGVGLCECCHGASPVVSFASTRI